MLKIPPAFGAPFIFWGVKNLGILGSNKNREIQVFLVVDSRVSSSEAWTFQQKLTLNFFADAQILEDVDSCTLTVFSGVPTNHNGGIAQGR